MRVLLIALLAAISYAQTAYLGSDDFDTWEKFEEHLEHPCSHTPHPCKHGATKCTEYLGQDYEEEWADTFVKCECADGYFGDTCENVHDPHKVYNNVAIKNRETGEVVPASCGKYDRKGKLVHGRVGMYEGFKACVDLNLGDGAPNYAVEVCDREYRELVCCKEDEILTRDLTRNGFKLYCTKPQSCTSNGKPGYMDIWDDYGDAFEVCDTGTAAETQEETKVGFNPLSRKCPERNICIHDCHKADGSKSRYECMQECPKSLCVEAVRAETKKEQNVGTNLKMRNQRLRKANTALQKLLAEVSVN